MVFGIVVCELCMFKVRFQKWLLSINSGPVSINVYIRLSEIGNHAEIIKYKL
jgi:hypothetical protein